MPVTLPKSPKPKPKPKPGTDEPDLPTVRVKPHRSPLDFQDDPMWSPAELYFSRPIMLHNIGVGDPVFEGRTLANTTLIEPGRQRSQKPSKLKRCVTTKPQTKDGNSKSDKKVCLQRDLIQIALEQYEIGYMVGYRVAKTLFAEKVECAAIQKNTRRLNDQIKRVTLSQEPSFPRVKSKTGVTRIGRRRKGIG